VNPVRPYLHPGLVRLWRGPSSVQLGLEPGRAVLLEGLDPGARHLLDQLDGTREMARLRAAAGPTGALLDALGTAGLLSDADADTGLGTLAPLDRERLAPDLASLALEHRSPGAAAARIARRREQRVLVIGAGRVGAQVAALLVAAGIGHLDARDSGVARAADLAPGGLRADALGEPREAGVARLLRAVRQERPPRHRAAAAEAPPPTFAVLTPVGLPLPDLPAAVALEQAGVPHLLAGVQETTGMVGPLVLPGVTACLGCRELLRADRDPGWPGIGAQLVDQQRSGLPSACDVSLSAAVAAAAAHQVLVVLDGGPPPAAAGGCLELALERWQWRRRSWAVHPACGCGTAQRLTSGSGLGEGAPP